MEIAQQAVDHPDRVFTTLAHKNVKLFLCESKTLFFVLANTEQTLIHSPMKNVIKCIRNGEIALVQKAEKGIY